MAGYTIRQLVMNAIDLRLRTTVGALAPKSVRQKIMEAADTRFRTLRFHLLADDGSFLTNDAGDHLIQ